MWNNTEKTSNSKSTSKDFTTTRNNFRFTCDTLNSTKCHLNTAQSLSISWTLRILRQYTDTLPGTILCVEVQQADAGTSVYSGIHLNLHITSDNVYMWHVCNWKCSLFILLFTCHKHQMTFRVLASQQLWMLPQATVLVYTINTASTINM